MALSIPWARITYQDYLKLPGEQRYEVLAGELTMVPAPGAPHQVVLANLNDILRAFIKLHNLGMVLFAPLDVILAEDSVVQPDLLFIRTDRLVILTTEGVRGAPGHVVEVLSPSTADHDRGVKRHLSGRHGVPSNPRKGTPPNQDGVPSLWAPYRCFAKSTVAVTAASPAVQMLTKALPGAPAMAATSMANRVTAQSEPATNMN